MVLRHTLVVASPSPGSCGSVAASLTSSTGAGSAFLESGLASDGATSLDINFLAHNPGVLSNTYFIYSLGLEVSGLDSAACPYRSKTHIAT